MGTKYPCKVNIEHWRMRLYKWVVLALWLVVSVFVFDQYMYNPKIFQIQNIENIVNHHTEHNFKMRKLCHCPRAEKLVFLNVSESYLESSCSDHATARGLGQKVVSYSFYGTVASPYFIGTKYNLKAVKQLYPGWVMRLYHNISMEDEAEREVLCKIWCDNDHFDVCDAHHLPSTLGDQSTIFGMLWRFLVLGDPLVDIFLVRDLDSMIIQREVDAVHHWLTDKNQPTWHIMRDNVMHGVPILGGMWGGMNRNLKLTTSLRQKFIASGQWWKKGYDQELLAKIVWPWACDDMVSHDSYLCQQYYGAQPWPTKRIGNQFVGDSFPWPPHEGNPRECPMDCRPPNQPNWTYC